jgi:hypothetical protein
MQPRDVTLLQAVLLDDEAEKIVCEKSHQILLQKNVRISSAGSIPMLRG